MSAELVFFGMEVSLPKKHPLSHTVAAMVVTKFQEITGTRHQAFLHHERLFLGGYVACELEAGKMVRNSSTNSTKSATPCVATQSFCTKRSDRSNHLPPDPIS